MARSKSKMAKKVFMIYIYWGYLLLGAPYFYNRKTMKNPT